MARSNRKLLLVGAMFALPSLVACASILGLDEFSKGECAGARCGDGGGDLQDQDVVPPKDGGSDVQVDGALGAGPVTWARWEMPNYASLDGGVLLPRQPSYSEAGPPDEVQDNVTKLIAARLYTSSGCERWIAEISET